MPLDNFAKELIRSPHYVGRSIDIMPHFRDFSKMKLTYSTIYDNTTRVCPHCFGNKIEIVDHYNGIATKQYCTICKGEGTVSYGLNRELKNQ